MVAVLALAAFATGFGMLLTASAALAAVAIVAARLAALLADFRHVLTVLRDLLSTFAANLGHVLAVLAYGFSALATRFRVPFRVPMPAAALAALITLAAALV